MDTAQWPQGIGVVKAVEENSKSINGGHVEKKPRPDKDQPVNCPRCNSTNTKFCYYNNYSLTQPRYFCKTCRRYWTAGGSLRNVPVGGGSRKNKRSSSSSSSSSSVAAAAASKKILTDLAPPIFSTQNPKIGNDLNLAYNPTSSYYSNDYVAGLPFGLGNKNFNPRNPNNLDLLKSSSSTTGNFMASFMNINNNNIPVSADPNPVYSTGFGGGGGVHDYKPSLGFSLDGIDQTGYGNNNNNNNILQTHHHHHHHNANIPSTILFPFEELKPVSATDEFERQDNDHGGGGGGQDGEITNGYWNGMLAGGSW